MTTLCRECGGDITDMFPEAAADVAVYCSPQCIEAHRATTEQI